MLPQPSISVITPTYNRAHLLPRVWRSLEKQTFKDFEWIVVDDGSTDNTQEIVDSFADSRIRYHRLSKNLGMNVARNRGVELSKAPYIVFLDSDDELVPEALAAIAEEWQHLDDEKVGIIAFRYQDADTGRLVGHMKGQRLKMEYKDIICEEKAKGDFLQTVRRDVFLTCRFSDTTLLTSLFLWDVAKIWKVLFINRPLGILHSGGDRLRSVKSAIRWAEILACEYSLLCKKHCKTWLAHCPGQYGRYLTIAGLYHATAGHRKEAVKTILKGLRFSPKKVELMVLLVAALLGKGPTRSLFRLRARFVRAGKHD